MTQGDFGGGDGWVMSQDHGKSQETGGSFGAGSAHRARTSGRRELTPQSGSYPRPRSLGIPTNLEHHPSRSSGNDSRPFRFARAATTRGDQPMIADYRPQLSRSR